MSRAIRLAALPLLVLVQGCTVPLESRGSPSARAARAGGRSGSAASTTRASPAPAAPSDPTIVRLTVNSESVTPDQMWRELYDELERAARDATPAERQELVARRAAQWITDKIAEMVLYQKASLRLSSDVDANIGKFVDVELRKIITRDFDGIQRRYEKHLARRGLTLEDIRARLRREIIIANYLDAELRPKLQEPTRDELVLAFEANRGSWQRPPRRKMSLVEVRVSTFLPREVESPTREQLAAARAEARAKIEAARQELMGGATFSEVARQYSSDLHAADGGAWGWVGPGSVRERYEPAVQALYHLPVGQISEVVESPESYFIVRCDELDPGHEPTFAEVQNELRERHLRIAYNELINQLVTDLRRRARIEPENLDRFHAAVVEAALNRGP
ncbi:MAG: peptidyl-prolyl cis-trans isomerase [Planctomycetes bacterium]|nr:peptidyl-prolyl cis-trans isomerase [Planctomycetota bacterium]